MTDVTIEKCSKAYLLVSPQTGIVLPITQFVIFMFLLHKSLVIRTFPRHVFKICSNTYPMIVCLKQYDPLENRSKA
ncbi:hypothetical protein L208DRAFT_540994 [Tricholoma matsutake]|nr:hypothetical protein L208DRAFT_540994 [Tricholoma matsutake 945]